MIGAKLSEGVFIVWATLKSLAEEREGRVGLFRAVVAEKTFGYTRKVSESANLRSCYHYTVGGRGRSVGKEHDFKDGISAKACKS